jgi:hypothetical protein
MGALPKTLMKPLKKAAVQKHRLQITVWLSLEHYRLLESPKHGQKRERGRQIALPLV